MEQGAASLRSTPESIHKPVINKSVSQRNHKVSRHAALQCQLDDTLILHDSDRSRAVHLVSVRGEFVSGNASAAYDSTSSLLGYLAPLSSISSPLSEQGKAYSTYDIDTSEHCSE